MNRVDHLVRDDERLSVGAKQFSVFLNGNLCPFLHVRVLTRAGYPEFGSARLSLLAFGSENPIAPPQAEKMVPMGSAVRIAQIVNSASVGFAPGYAEMLEGFVERIETSINEKKCSVEVTVRDVSCRLERIAVFGQRMTESDGNTVVLRGLDTVFNPEGKPNASASEVAVDGRVYRIFCCQQSQAKAWSYAEVIRYLLAEYAPVSLIKLPAIERLEALCRYQVVRELDITGLSLIEALWRCCSRIRVRFCFESIGRSGLWAVRFWRNGKGKAVEINSQYYGEKVNISKTQIAALESVKTTWPVTSKYTVQGDFKAFEATFELAKAWDPALETTDQALLSPTTNADFYKVRDVYRKWCLNEAGDYSGLPFNQGQAFDFRAVFGTKDYGQTRRRFWPSLTCGSQGKSLGYYVQVSYDNGEHWWQYLHAFNNLLDECGIWLSCEQFDFDTWWAALKGVLKFRITATVISDERLAHVHANGPVNSTAEVAEHVSTLPRLFKFRQVSPQSIFYKSADSALGRANEVDDSSAMVEFTRGLSLSKPEVIERIKVHTPVVMTGYAIGDCVTCSPESNDLLGLRSDNRSRHVIERVEIDVDNQQSVLDIVRTRQY